VQATRPVAQPVTQSQTSPPVPFLIVLLFVVIKFIKTDHESLSGLICVHKQSAWLPCPMPARSQADAYRSIFLDENCLTRKCKNSDDKSVGSNQQNYCPEIGKKVQKNIREI